MHFTANADLIFLRDKLPKDSYLVDTVETHSIVPCTSNSGPSGPLVKGANGLPIPSWGFVPKLSSSKTNFSLPIFCKLRLQVPFWALIFLENSKSLLLQRPAKSCLLMRRQLRPPPNLSFFKALSRPTHTVRIHLSATAGTEITGEVLQSNSQGNQSIVGPPLSVLPITESTPTQTLCLQMSNFYFKNFPLYSTQVMWCPILPMEGNTTFIRVDTNQFSQKPAALTKLEIDKAEFKCLESTGIVRHSTSPWVSPLHMVPKKMGFGSLVVITSP
jgi:hypothetical protein